jgi:hypothetical protein
MSRMLKKKALLREAWAMAVITDVLDVLIQTCVAAFLLKRSQLSDGEEHLSPLLPLMWNPCGE